MDCRETIAQRLTHAARRGTFREAVSAVVTEIAEEAALVREIWLEFGALIVGRIDADRRSATAAAIAAGGTASAMGRLLGTRVPDGSGGRVAIGDLDRETLLRLGNVRVRAGESLVASGNLLRRIAQQLTERQKLRDVWARLTPSDREAIIGAVGLNGRSTRKSIRRVKAA